MVSRLDRLFILLDTGSNDSIRLAAAKQLGEVQRVQPNDLNYLLQRIKEYSGKSVWETRTAAGQATRCVLEHVPAWPGEESNSQGTDSKMKCRQDIAEGLIEQEVKTEQILKEFDIDKIMQLCPKLLSLDISDIDNSELVSPSVSKITGSKSKVCGRDSTSKGSARKAGKEQLIRQRKLINKELGIAMVDSLDLGVKSTDIVTNDDLQTEYNIIDTNSASTKSSQDHTQLDRKMALQKVMSNYERILDRLFKENCTQISVDNEAKSSTTEGSPVKNDLNEWPLSNIAKQYTDDLFNPSWEIRHGAAIALREIVRLQGKSAGKRLHLKENSNKTLNQLWLVDMALRALSVLALDKFGDFLFDQVVAPVRENAAQLLSCCLAHMSETNSYATIKILLKLLENSNWETRHGGILGLKYYLNLVDESFSRRMLEECFDPIFKCLADPVDDVSAEAAASLVPVKDLMIETIPDKAPKLIRFLWDHLADLDELTTSTSNIVLLLASLITSSSTQPERSELIMSIPRLWALFSHSSTSVRVSVLKAFITLMKSQKTTCLSWMPEELLATALRLVFQRSILENMDEVRPFIEDVWMLLIEINEDTPQSSAERLTLLKATSQFLNFWLCLIMQPFNSPIDRGSQMWLNIRADGSRSDAKPDGDVYIGSCTFNAETINEQKLQVTKCRLLGTRLVGALYANLVNDFGDTLESQHSKETLKYLADMFNHYTKTKSANQRIISGWAIESWASHQKKLLEDNEERLRTILPKSLIDQLNQAIQEISLCHDELASSFTRLQQEARNFVAALKDVDVNLNLASPNDKRAIYNLNQIQSFCELDLEAEMTKVALKRSQTSSTKVSELSHHNITKSETYTSLYDRRINLSKTFKSTQAAQKSLSTSVLSSLACALISWRLLPEPMKLVTQPLLDSIEIEEEQSLQDKSINYLVVLIDILSHNLEQFDELLESILNKLVDSLSCKNLAAIQTELGEICPTGPQSNQCVIDKKNGSDSYKIVLLDNLQRKAELSRSLSRRQSSINSTSSLKRSHSLTSPLDAENDPASSAQDEYARAQTNSNDLSIDVKLRGASIAARKLANQFADQLPQKLPLFWQTITSNIKSHVELLRKEPLDSNQTVIDATKLIKSLKLLEVVGESLDHRLRHYLLDLYNDLIFLLTSPNPMIRHHSAQCIGIISKLMLSETIDSINNKIIPMLEQDENILARCGSIEAIAFIIERLQLDLVPRIEMFIIHVLRRMSDQNDQIRLMATHCFGKLLSLMPLNLEESWANAKTNEDRKDILKSTQQDNQRFIEQLLDPKKLDNFTIPFEIKAELRTYQQDGLNWLAFLNRFNLHGILCDEMGLGKTLMTICMVASDHFNAKKNGEDDQSASIPPSLIVCPSTLTEHWLYEIEKFLPSKTKSILNPVAYFGSIYDRMNIRQLILRALNRGKERSDQKVDDSQRVDLVVVSYDIVRNDIDFFKDVHWNYCVLDEGHIIKNGKTKLSRSIRLLNAKHRLILSGTPIQNNVTELWSLFDFLMPGFLGSERQFNSRYAKPILQSRELKCSARELEAGALAMESLHRQVLPFILRRLKEDVLDDLPPKIIQDYFCELSPLQHKLYEDFTGSKLCKEVTRKSVYNLSEEGESAQEAKAESKSHVFQALQYLKSVCNHPKLVLSEKHSQYQEIKKSLASDKGFLNDINHSSKLKALKQLLLDCGIGVLSQSGDEQQQQQALTTIQSVINQHRALIFCQVRSMVDIIEFDLLKKHFPNVTYLKLDGSVPSNQRQSIVSRFNNDPSIDILLLTTKIGGLGLNLTGADTVIFVEHDWNPTKDLQAMDRAHRIGQKKVVNVYRLITKGTLEEKIMGLQKFKTMVSNTVINQDNAGLGTMKVDQLFELLESTGTGDTGSGSAIACGKKSDSGSDVGGGLKSSSSFLDLLPELWDQQQYETEYDLSNFVSSLKK